MRIARVFPRKTSATPDDELAFTTPPPVIPPEVDEVHVSVTWTYDLPKAEMLARAWSHVASVHIGGPATGMRGEEFVPGMYVKKGYVITSRGCPNRCWFCSVWRREGDRIRELPVTNGWNLLDDNILATSDDHIQKVFKMLKASRFTKPDGSRLRPQFTGGLEAKRLKPWHAELLRDLRPEQMFFAYDTPDDLEPLIEAGRLLRSVGYGMRSAALRAYVLIGYPKDTFEDAERRLWETVDAGFYPMAMLYRDQNGERDHEWMKFQRPWARMAAIHTMVKKRDIERGIKF